jgi:hypothetical protein
MKECYDYRRVGAGRPFVNGNGRGGYGRLQSTDQATNSRQRSTSDVEATQIFELQNDRGKPLTNVIRGHLGSVDGQSGLHVEFEAAVRVHMLPDQRCQGAEISGG